MINWPNVSLPSPRHGCRVVLALMIGFGVLVIRCEAQSRQADSKFSPDQDSPNIVFILADDLGIMDTGVYAQRFTGASPHDRYYETPHIDALARRGVAFSQAYANQLCSPTRAAILTGRFPSRLGVTTAVPRTKTYYNQGMKVPDGYREHDAFGHADRIALPQAWLNGHTNTALPHDVTNLTDVLANYESVFIGKWHLGGHGADGQQPRHHGFRELAYYDAGGSPYFNWRKLWDNKKPFFATSPQKESLMGNSGTATGKDFLTEDLTVQAIEYLRQRSRQQDQPFFLYFCHFSVHTPLQAKPETIEHFESKPQRGVGGQDNPTYAAMVKHLDDSVGAIIAALEETGLARNTLVVFTSDNGGVEYTQPPATDNAPFKGGKACLHEGGVRVPLIYYLPGRIEGGKWCDSPVCCTDFLPTLAELTGHTIPPDLNGQSILPLLLAPEQSAGPRTMIWHYPFNVIVKHPDDGLPLTPHSAIRVGDDKLIWDWHGRLQLYDIAGDPYEQRDLAAERPERVAELFEQLRDWLKQNVDKQYFPQRNPTYDSKADSRSYNFRDLWNE